MKRILLLAAMIGSGFVAASPSMAQPVLQLGISSNGSPQISVRDPARERYDRREYWRQRREAEQAAAYEQGRRDAWRQRREAEQAAAYEQGRRDAWRQRQAYRGYNSRCRNITIREKNEWGRTVTRRIRRCD
jgi:hypothetical protein